MHPDPAREIVRPSSVTRTGPSESITKEYTGVPVPAPVAPIVAFDGVSKWYGNVIGLNKLTLHIPAGVTGLLGPNGAGKSTLLQLATGQLRPSQGMVRVLGQAVWGNPGLMRYIGLCPEQDAFYEWMTGFDFARTCALLTGMGRRQATAAAEKALETVGMTENMNRAIRGYSKGMRQRTKIAQALVHEPRVLFLDEPFSGTDPVARHDLIEVIRGLGAAGCSVLVSSHVLHEVQALTPNIILLHRGRLVAEGNVRQLRDLIDGHPHRIVLVCDDYRGLAARVVAWDNVDGVKVMSGERALLVETRQPDDFYGRLPALAGKAGVEIREVYSEDDNLEAVFKYLVSR
jgi:ABC-2 type transport system ATP-binding protein